MHDGATGDEPAPSDVTAWGEGDAPAPARTEADDDSTRWGADDVPPAGDETVSDAAPGAEKTAWDGSAPAAPARPHNPDETMLSDDAPFLRVGRPGLLAPGSVVEGYEILTELSQGGMGTVLRARELSGDREVAIKLPAHAGLNEEQRLRWKNDAQRMADLEHPGIVRLLSTGEVEGAPYLVYELVEGSRTFKEVLRAATLRRRVELLVSAGRALGYAHSRGVAHRNVKTANLLLDAWGTLRIADFGIAAAINIEGLTASGRIAETPSFMAPEQILDRKEDVGAQTDVWALGVLLYLALTNTLPFEGMHVSHLTQQIVNDAPAPIQQRNPRAPSALVAVCLRALSKEPATRHSDGEAFAHALSHAVASTPPEDLDRAASDKRRFQTRTVSRERSTRRLSPKRVKLSDAPNVHLDRIFDTGSHPALDELGPGRRRVRDPQLCRDVDLHLLQLGQPLESFHRHARILGQLDHPVIPKIYRFGETAYSTELMEGQTLIELLHEYDTDELSQQALLRAFLEVCSAVSHAHGRRLLHTEIGPHCMVLGSFGRVWLHGWEAAVARTNPSRAVRKATAPPPLARASTAPCIAPEILTRDGETVRSDVWGLGTVLRWMLVQSVPGQEIDPERLAKADVDLMAIVRKATAEEPGDRYGQVHELQEDVRRYLDGRRVEADTETPARTIRRLARNHPLAAAVVAVFGVLLIALFAWTARTISASMDSAQRARALAAGLRLQFAQSDLEEQQSLRRAAAIQDLTRGWQSLRDGLIEARGQISQGADDVGLEARFEELAKTAAALLKQAEALASEADDPSLREQLLDIATEVRAEAARVHRIRGDWQLEAANSPSPERALASYQAQADLTPDDAEAWHGQLLASRGCLPGGPAPEPDPLTTLATLPGPLGKLATLLPQIERAEALVARGNSSEAADVVALPLAELQGLKDTQRGGALTWELLARAHLCAANLSARERTREQKDHYHAAADLLTELARLDPSSAEPRVLLIKSYDAFHGEHTSTRLPSGFQFSELERVVRQQQHPEPTLEMITELQRQAHVSASLPFTEKLMDLGAKRLGADHGWLRAQLAHARARLSAGKAVAVDLDGLEIPPPADEPRALQWSAQRDLLGAHTHLLAGRAPEAARALSSALARLDASFAESQVITDRRQLTLVQLDLRRACLDPRVDPKIATAALDVVIGSVLERLRAQGRTDAPPYYPVLLILRAYRSSQAGMDSTQDLAVISQLRKSSPNFDAAVAGRVLDTLQRIASARHELNANATNPTIHTGLLAGWASVNLGFQSNERFAQEYQRLIAKRLEALGDGEAAGQFKAIDAVNEVWVRRLWVSETMHQPDPELRAR